MCIIIYEEVQAVLQNYRSGALYTMGCSCRDIAMNKMNYSSIHRSKALPYIWGLCFSSDCVGMFL